MITYKSKGRPSKAVKDKVREINKIISGLPEEERANYNRQINDAGELDSIFSSLSNSEPKKEEKETFMDSKDEILDFTDVTSDNGQQETDSIPSFFNPLEEPIQERNYNRIDTKDVGDIEEPEFGGQGQFENVEDVPPVFEVEEVEEVPREKVTDKIKNEALTELDGTEKKMAVEQLVEMVLDGYEMLHQLAQNRVVYPESKLKEQIVSGEIDPNDEIVINQEGDTQNPIGFIQEYNQDAIDACSLDPEFREKVTPPMERVFAKKGWGMTDEQYLLLAFGKDISMKALNVVMLRKNVTAIMEAFVEKNKIMKEQQMMTPQNPSSIDRPEPTENNYENQENEVNSYEADATA